MAQRCRARHARTETVRRRALFEIGVALWLLVKRFDPVAFRGPRRSDSLDQQASTAMRQPLAVDR
jgi:hypothetical protein